MSEYKELVKNFASIRGYMRDFYVYGFKTRSDYSARSARTYDNERRRIENWLGDYIKWDYSAKGKRVFISVDSAQIKSNPFYEAWKSKSFTANDCMLHFYLLDILKTGQSYPIPELTDQIQKRYEIIIEPQTIRNKCKEYEKLGIFESQREGKTLLYKLSSQTIQSLPHFEKLLCAIQFFSEAAPLGFMGSTLLDNTKRANELFRFKHHFIVHTLEDEIVEGALEAMVEKRAVELESVNRRTGNISSTKGIPVRIAVSTQTGRRYLCLYNPIRNRCATIRLDYITNIKQKEVIEGYAVFVRMAQAQLSKNWGVAFRTSTITEKVKIVFFIEEEKEGYIIERIEREKRTGSVTRVGLHTYEYEVYVSDANEMLPWVKSFVGRILSFECSNKAVMRKFYEDMEKMMTMYG